MSRRERRKIGVIGPGRVGSAFALGLFKAGWTICQVYGRRWEHAETLARWIKSGVASGLSQVIAEAELILVTVPDDIIPGMAQDIAAGRESLEGKIFFHTSGVLETVVLHPIKEKGGVIGSIHPLQTFADREHGWQALAGSWFALDGQERALFYGEELARAVGGKSFVLESGTKPLYHAAACIASNYLVTLEYIAASLFQLCGVKKDDFYDLIGPLLERTVVNIKKRGVSSALTGPVSRGDSGTVDIHLKSLQHLTPEFVDFYQIMLDHTVKLAREHGYIQEETAKEFLRLNAGEGNK